MVPAPHNDLKVLPQSECLDWFPEIYLTAQQIWLMYDIHLKLLELFAAFSPNVNKSLKTETFSLSIGGLLSRGLESLTTLTLGSSKINQHCWRFHGSGVIAAPQIIGLISFCTGMHHEYFLRSPMCFRVPHLCSKIPKINNWTGEFATVIWCLHCFTVSFGGDVRGESGPR